MSSQVIQRMFGRRAPSWAAAGSGESSAAAAARGRKRFMVGPGREPRGWKTYRAGGTARRNLAGGPRGGQRAAARPARRAGGLTNAPRCAQWQRPLGSDAAEVAPAGGTIRPLIWPRWQPGPLARPLGRVWLAPAADQSAAWPAPLTAWPNPPRRPPALPQSDPISPAVHKRGAFPLRRREQGSCPP